MHSGKLRNGHIISKLALSWRSKRILFCCRFYKKQQKNTSWRYGLMTAYAQPGCIQCKTHAWGTPVAPQVYNKVESWRTPEVQRSKEPCVEICILLRQYAKQYNLGYIHATTQTRKRIQRRSSSGLSHLVSASNALWCVM